MVGTANEKGMRGKWEISFMKAMSKSNIKYSDNMKLTNESELRAIFS